MKLKLIILCAALSCAFPSLLHASEMESHVVRIIVTSQSYDYNSPWNKNQIKRYEIAGCVIEGQRIVTTAYSLADHIMVEVFKEGGTKRYPAEVIVKDYHCGLAILKVNDPEFFQGLRPATFHTGGSLSEKDAMVYRWDYLGSFKSYKAELNKSSIRFYSPNCGILIHQFTSVMDDGVTGEPVFVDNKLVGIVTGLDTKSKALFVISADFITRMLDDLSDNKYDGMPFFWVDATALESDLNLREYLGLSDKDEGILVTDVPAISSGGDVLKVLDVITTIDGVNIDDNGMYRSKKYGPLNYAGLIFMDKKVGDTLTVEIIRSKKNMKLSFKLKPIPSDCCTIPLYSYDVPSKYMVYGGLLFQELSIGYLETWGESWEQKADKRLLNYADNMKDSLLKSGINRVVILNRVLPFPVNNGYQHNKDLVLLTINGQKVKDLGHLKEILDKSSSTYIKFDFKGEISIILDRKTVMESEGDLLKKYNISAPHNIR